MPENQGYCENRKTFHVLFKQALAAALHRGVEVSSGRELPKEIGGTDKIQRVTGNVASAFIITGAVAGAVAAPAVTAAMGVTTAAVVARGAAGGLHNITKKLNERRLRVKHKATFSAGLTQSIADKEENLDVLINNSAVSIGHMLGPLFSLYLRDNDINTVRIIVDTIVSNIINFYTAHPLITTLNEAHLILAARLGNSGKGVSGAITNTYFEVKKNRELKGNRHYTVQGLMARSGTVIMRGENHRFYLNRGWQNQKNERSVKILARDSFKIPEANNPIQLSDAYPKYPYLILDGLAS